MQNPAISKRDLTQEKEWISRAKQGDSDAVAELYERFHLGIFRYLYYRSGDSHAADDLTSEVFLRMMRALSSFRLQESAFQAWLYQIARNVLIDHFRKSNTRNDVPLEENIMEGTDTIRTRPVERALNSITLQKALDRLSVEQRDVIVMRFVSGMPIYEVAQALNRSEDAVKGLQRRALSNLRDVLVDWEIHYG
jgi:RNA polymerase sigma-70 factor (ECF subfamily)